MNLRKILSSKAIVFFAEMPNNISNAVAYDIVRGIEGRYKFLQVPISTDSLDLQRGIEFRFGSLRGEVDIKSLKIYRDGMICEGEVDTDICDSLLSDLLQWIEASFGSWITVPNDLPRLYNSVLEIETSKNFERKFESLSKIGTLAAEKVSHYGTDIPDLLVSKIEFSIDPSHTDNIPQIGFSFERRQGVPFEHGIYFSASHMKTSDHLEVLTELEELLV